MTSDKEAKSLEDNFNLQLIFTEQCNLRCRYCFEIDKGPRQMPLELAKRILERELTRGDGPGEYQVDIMGGEPFLLFDEVKELVEYFKLHTNEYNKKFYFVIGTNLTLLNSEIERWLVENKHMVILAISLDGTRDVHNHYRCDSYDAVIRNLPFYKQLYPSQGVKMTIGP